MINHDFTKIADIVSKKINEQPGKFIPNIMKEINQIKSIKDKQEILSKKISMCSDNSEGKGPNKDI